MLLLALLYNFVTTIIKLEIGMADLTTLLNMLRNNVPHLRTLKQIAIDRDSICIGNNAVVARCCGEELGGEVKMKCYYRPHRNLAKLYGKSYYPREVGLYTLMGHIDYLDAVITPWVEGQPLDRALHDPDADYLSLSRAFDAMARDTLAQAMAHGDIKPDNIIVRDDSSMQLIDWDAAWRPDIDHIEEWGTVGFRHPLRRSSDFNKHIDDYPIALIATMLAALAAEPEYFAPHLNDDGSMFSPESLLRGKDALLDHAIGLFAERGDVAHYRIAKSLYTQHMMIPRLADYLRYSYVALPKAIPEGCTAEYYEGMWGCHLNGVWIVPPLYDELTVIDDHTCQLRLDEQRISLKMCGKIDFDTDIPADLEHRMRRLEALRASERKLVLPHAMKSTLGGAPRRWSADEDERLVMMYSDNRSVRYIAYMLQRSEAAIRRHLSTLHLPRKK